MINQIPHVIPYQGSKRKIAAAILDYVDFEIDTLYEPFAGSAAITLAAASRNLAKSYILGEKLISLAQLWEIIINDPNKIIREYTRYWVEQSANPKEYYLKVRKHYNKSKSPSALFYLIARCVKNSIRFNPSGEFNQSADNRRLGMKPEKLRKEVAKVSKLLQGKTEVISGDFREVLQTATASDLVYLDPPWSGLGDNPRYAYLLDLNSLIDELRVLNKKNIPYLLSLDGSCGDKTYEINLPNDLDLIRVPIHAGKSTQATLLGRTAITIESLYLSPALRNKEKKASPFVHEEKYSQLLLAS